MTASAVTLRPFALPGPHPLLDDPDQPLRPLYHDTHYGLRIADIGEDGDWTIILGHAGMGRAIAALRAHAHEQSGSRYDVDQALRSIQFAAQHIKYTWAVLITAPCSTYPMCRSLGPVADGSPCHDDAGKPYPEHQWTEWDSVGGQTQLYRWCPRCDLEETDPPSAQRNPCQRCVIVEDCGNYVSWDNITRDTPGAFPVMVWAC